MVGTESVGYYSNYNIVIGKLSGIVNTIFYSLTASLGNLIVTESYEKRYQIFQVMQSISLIIGNVCIACVFFLEEDFITIWLGEEYSLGFLVLCAIVINFYFSIVLLPIWVFREASGLYRKTKYVMLITAVVNIVASILLGKWIGLAGILFATSIARFTTYFWYEPLLLFKQYFNQSCIIYYKGIVKGLMITMLTFGIIYVAVSWYSPQSWIEWFIKGCVVGFIAVAVTFFCYRKLPVYFK